MNPLLALVLGMLLSISPIIELRGGIPFAVTQGVNPLIAFIFCSLANIIVIPIAFLFLNYLHRHLLKFNFYSRSFNVFLKKLRKRKEKVKKNYQIYGIIALTLFVAIPLPITGAWTGSLIAWLLNFKKGKSFLAISLGVIIAGIIVTLIVTGILTALGFLI